MDRALVVRFSSIGDVVLTSPIVRSLCEHGFKVDFLTKRAFADLVRYNPAVERVWALEDYKSFSELVSALKKERYSAIFDLHGNLRTLRLRLAMFKTPFYTYDKCWLNRFLYVNFKIQRECKHVVLRYAQTLRKAEIPFLNRGLELHLPSGLDVPDLPDNYWVLVVGAAHRTKQIPEDKGAYLLDTIGGNSVLLGGKKELESAKEILKLTSRRDVLSLVGKLSLLESAYVIKNARFIVTPDTGMMHIAAAFRKPMIVIWGNTVPEFGMGPYVPEQHVPIFQFEVKGLKCRPCHKHGRDKCPKGHWSCMYKQDWGSIVEAGRTLCNYETIRTHKASH
ncbi:MAG: glycosyltransferase family 9 protein [Chlorobi bacterium]|nr:glycosyltransferase family 9 protein [Chlorobiota bacterium]